jgi:ribosomal protein L35
MVTFKKSNTGHLKSNKSGRKLMKLRTKSVAKKGDIRHLSHMLYVRLTPGDDPQ